MEAQIYGGAKKRSSFLSIETMTTQFCKGILPSATGPSVFLDQGLGQELIMNGGSPTVEWSFRIDQLRDYIQTIESQMARDDQARMALEAVYCCLLAAHMKHEKQHAQAITEAPSAEDLQEYLASYSVAIGQGDF